MKVEILSILPGLLRSYLQEGMIGRAIRESRLKVNLRYIRDYATDKHHMTDDTPYGGGPGLVMKAEPLANAHNAISKNKSSRTIFLTPQGKTFSSETAKRLAKYKQLIFVCGRYEGVDQRFRDKYVDEEISIGDYVLTGGELASLVVLDAVSRFIPGVLGNDQSAECDSFSDGLLEHPQYTKPREFEGMEVPEVMTSGNHKLIKIWQHEKSLAKTREIRPELYEQWVKDNPPQPQKKKRKRH